MLLEESVCVGPYASKEPLIDRQAGGEDLAAAVAVGKFAWHGEGNAFHRFNNYFAMGKAASPQTLLKWRALWKQAAAKGDREADPIFRVWPDDYELQETIPLDFEPRFGLNRLGGQRIQDAGLGADVALLPEAPSMIFERPPATPELAARPRGRPRVLRVHQKEGPYKTLESAFAELQDEEIIEIADDGPYIPKRDFSRDPATAVLNTAVDITLRAAPGVEPVVVMSDEAQANLGTQPLFLISSHGDSLHLRGIHFRTQIVRNVTRLMLEFIPRSPMGLFRCDSCTFADYSTAGSAFLLKQTGYGAPRSLFIDCRPPGLMWIENSTFFPTTLGYSIVIRWDSKRDQGACLGLLRNYLGDGDCAYLDCSGANSPNCMLRLQNCTMGGSKPVKAHVRFPWVVEARDNLVLNLSQEAFDVRSTKNPLEVEVSPKLMGRMNALFDVAMTQLPNNAAERTQMLPGQLTSVLPTFEGASTPKDPYRRFRLKTRQSPPLTATDGGPVGVRFEYLPNLPALPPQFFQARPPGT